MKASRDEVASFLSGLGYQVNRYYKFKARESENTASAIINKDGTIHDFGDGFHGDLVDFLVANNGYSVKDALSATKQFSNTPFTPVEHTTEKKSEDKRPITREFIEMFYKERKENFARFCELLENTLPTFSFQKRKEIALKYEIGYSKMADRLVMPIKNEKGEITTLWKYNPLKRIVKGDDGKDFCLPKVTFTKGRERSPFNMGDLISFGKDKDKPVFMFEGEKDTLNALASGLRAITLGSASDTIKDSHLPFFNDMKIVIVYDNDEAGNKGAMRLQD